MAVADTKVCLFSEVSGTVTLRGQPVASVRVIQTSTRGTEQVVETRTAEDGSFHFPSVYHRGLSNLLPQEFVAKQSLVVFHQDQPYPLWEGVKRDPAENVEAGGKPLVLTCELTDEEQVLLVGGGSVITLCRFDAVQDAPADTDNFFDPSWKDDRNN